MPEIHESVFVAETAAVIGDVHIGKNSSVWYSAVVRGDIRPSRELSLYGRVGDLFVLLCGISVLGAMVIRRPTRATAALQDRVGS